MSGADFVLAVSLIANVWMLWRTWKFSKLLAAITIVLSIGERVTHRMWLLAMLQDATHERPVVVEIAHVHENGEAKTATLSLRVGQ
jgi:hypothetical protein